MGTGTLVTEVWKRNCSSPVCECDVLATEALVAKKLSIKIYEEQRYINVKIQNFVPSQVCVLKNDVFRECCGSEINLLQAVNYLEE